MNIRPLKIGNLTAKIPVIQGGMGIGISMSGLAGAVALEGGVGVISAAQAGYRDPAYDKAPVMTNLRCMQEEIKKAKNIAKGGIIGVNIMVATKFYKEYIKAAVEAAVDLIICGAGIPAELPELTKGSDTKIAPIVSTLKSAKVIMKMWDRHYKRVPDLVVIEGPRAGGHLGFSKEQIDEFTPELYEKEVIQIIEYVKSYETEYEKEIPVVVAGGVYERADMEKYISLGADGVQMGTRFVTTYECDAADAYKEAYIKAEKQDIELVKSPVGMPGRVIRNRFTEEIKRCQKTSKKCHQCVSMCRKKDIPYCITDALVNAATGNIDEGLLFCGENAYRAHKLEHVKEIMKEFAP